MTQTLFRDARGRFTSRENAISEEKQEKRWNRDARGRFCSKSGSTRRSSGSTSRSRSSSKDVLEADIYFVIDHSGSMSFKTSQINSGVNEFIDEQKKIEGRVNLNITEFGTTVVHRYSGPIKNYNKRYRVSINGMTALYQAIGEAIDKAEQSTEEAKIVNFVIVTDGLENASRGYYRFLTNLQERIQEAQNKGWIFTFLAEGQNIMEQGWKAGIETGTCTVVTENTIARGIKMSSSKLEQARNKVKMGIMPTNKDFAYNDNDREALS